MKRIVVKIGSNVLTTARGKLDITRMSAIVDQVAWMREQGYSVVVVSSGAVACGRKELSVSHELDSVEQRQLYSAVGQPKLMSIYSQLFGEYGIHVGQVLTTKEHFESGEQYLYQSACIEVMLQNGVVPIVNENDTVCVTELMFTDNDELSGLIARMVLADGLVLLSNIDGIYTGNPQDPEARVIREVRHDDNLDRYIQSSKSSAGRGGMTSKYNTARTVAEAGIRVIIANGTRENILPDLITAPDKTIHTEFIPKKP